MRDNVSEYVIGDFWFKMESQTDLAKYRQGSLLKNKIIINMIKYNGHWIIFFLNK